LPHLRHGPRAAHHHARRRQSRTARHDAPLLDQRGLNRALLAIAMEGMFGRSTHARRLNAILPLPRPLLQTPWCSGPAASSSAMASIVQPQLQHVHVDRHGTALAYSYSVIATLFPRYSHRHSAVWQIARRLFRSSSAIVTLVCRADSNSPPVAAPRAPFAHCSTSARRCTAGHIQTMMAILQTKSRDIPLADVKPGDACVCRLEKKFLSTNRPRRQSLSTNHDHRRTLPVKKRRSRLIGRHHQIAWRALVMRAERVGSETMLAQIVQMVSQAQRTRAPIQRLADKVAGWLSRP